MILRWIRRIAWEVIDRIETLYAIYYLKKVDACHSCDAKNPAFIAASKYEVYVECLECNFSKNDRSFRNRITSSTYKEAVHKYNLNNIWWKATS